MVDRILLTGAAGRIGKALRPYLRERYAHVRLADRDPITDLAANEEAVQLDIADAEAVGRAVGGTDAIVHLAAAVSSGGWEGMWEPNIVGAYNVFEAAWQAGVRRIVYASSIHAHGFHRRDQRIGPDTPPRPDSIYGVTKVFSEALGRLYADKHGMEVVCLRIASFQPEPTTVRHLGTWLSPRDCAHLVERALEAENVHFEVVWGVSANTRQLYDNPAAARIGYAPQDDAEAHAADVLARMKPEDEPEMERQFHGAMYVARDFTGDRNKL